MNVFFWRNLPNTASNRSPRSLSTWCFSVLTFGMIKSPPWTLPIPPCGRWTLCPLLIPVRVSRHLWVSFCFLLQSLQGRQCMLEIRSVPQWHSIRTLLIWMKPPFALIERERVFWCGQMVSVIFIRKSIPSSTKIFVSMIFNHSITEFLISYESVMDSLEILLFAFLLQLVSRVIFLVSRLFTISMSMKSSLLHDILRDWKKVHRIIDEFLIGSSFFMQVMPACAVEFTDIPVW